MGHIAVLLLGGDFGNSKLMLRPAGCSKQSHEFVNGSVSTSGNSNRGGGGRYKKIAQYCKQLKSGGGVVEGSGEHQGGVGHRAKAHEAVARTMSHRAKAHKAVARTMSHRAKAHEL